MDKKKCLSFKNKDISKWPQTFERWSTYCKFFCTSSAFSPHLTLASPWTSDAMQSHSGSKIAPKGQRRSPLQFRCCFCQTDDEAASLAEECPRFPFVWLKKSNSVAQSFGQPHLCRKKCFFNRKHGHAAHKSFILKFVPHKDETFCTL